MKPETMERRLRALESVVRDIQRDLYKLEKSLQPDPRIAKEIDGNP